MTVKVTLTVSIPMMLLEHDSDIWIKGFQTQVTVTLVTLMWNMILKGKMTPII